MRKMKRFVSLLLAVAMLLTSAVFTLAVSAEEELPAVEVTDADWLLVEKLEAFGAITNEYEDIGMYVTRRQMVDIITKYLRMQVAGTATGKSPFMDVPKNDISIDAITALYNAGIITGDNEYKFHPDDYLTYDEAIVFVVNSVGHKLFAAREGGFPTGYHRIAIKEGMLEGLKFNSGKDYIPLCDVYKMLESAMDVGAVVPVTFTSGEVDYQVSDTDTFLSDVYDIVEYKGIVTGTENTRLTKPDSNMTDEQVEIDGVVYDTPGYVYATSLGRAVYYYVRKTADGEMDVAYVEENNKVNNLKAIDGEDLLISKATADRIYYYDDADKERHINLDENVDVIYNGKCYRGYGVIKNVLPEEGYIEALDNTGDEVYEVLFVYDYKTVVVGAVDSYEQSFMAMFKNEDGTYDEFDLSTHGDKIDIRLMPDGTELRLESLKQWDIATIMESKSDPKMITIYVSRDTVTGTVEEISDEYGAKIGGTYYEIANDYVGAEIVAGMGAIFYLDFTGKITTIERDGTTAVGDYAVLIGIDYDDNPVASGIETKIYTAAGELRTLKLKNVLSIDGKRFNSSSNLEETAEYLAGGAKNENGQYLIEEPYVIRVVISGDVISSIDTGKTGEDGKLQRIAHGSSNMLSRTDGFLKAANSDGTTLYTYFKKNETIVFCIPKLEDINDLELYSIMNGLPDSRIYHKMDPNAVKYAHDVDVDSYSLYNLAGNGIERADVILLNGVNLTDAKSTGVTGLKVVTKVTTAINGEGEEAAILYVNESVKELVAPTVTIDDINSKKEKISATKINDYVKPGMTITTSKNGDGEVANISILAAYDAETDEVAISSGKIASRELINTDANYTIQGTVRYIDAEEKLLQVDDGTRVQIMPLKGSVITYRPQNEKAINGTVNDIAEGDQVIINGTRYYQISTIIVYKR